MVVCIALGVDVFRGGPCPSLYIRRDSVTWKVLAEYSCSTLPGSIQGIVFSMRSGCVIVFYLDYPEEDKR